MPQLPLNLVLKNSQRALSQQDYASAQRGFLRLEKYKPYRHQAWLHLAQIALLTGQLEQALNLTQKALKDHPNSHALHHFLATACNRQNN